MSIVVPASDTIFSECGSGSVSSKENSDMKSVRRMLSVSSNKSILKSMDGLQLSSKKVSIDKNGSEKNYPEQAVEDFIKILGEDLCPKKSCIVRREDIDFKMKQQRRDSFMRVMRAVIREVSVVGDMCKHNHESFNFRYPISDLPMLPHLEKDFNYDLLMDIEHITDGSNSNIYKGAYVLNSDQNKINFVIIKIIKEDPHEKEVAVNEFKNERELLSRLSHPHILDYFGGGNIISENGYIREFLVLERLSKGSLQEVLHRNARQKKCFKLMDVLEIGRAIASALAYLHETFHPEITLIHRDLKPDNLGFSSNGILKLMDFGLMTCVRRRDELHDTYTMTGSTGSLRYMAPESMKNKPYNEFVDIYSLALIIWQIAIGKPPYAGLTRNDFIEQVVKEKTRPPIPLNHPNIPETLRECLRKCWNENWQERPCASRIVTELDIMIEKHREETTLQHHQSGIGCIIT